MSVAKHSNFVSRMVAEVGQFLETYQELQQLRAEWDALGYSSAITQTDLDGLNSHLTPQMLADAFSSLAAIKAVMDQGHATNLYKIVP